MLYLPCQRKIWPVCIQNIGEWNKIKWRKLKHLLFNAFHRIKEVNERFTINGINEKHFHVFLVNCIVKIMLKNDTRLL